MPRSPAKSPALASTFPIHEAAAILRCEILQWKVPIVTRLAQKRRDPFRTLIGTMLSLRTKDDCTEAATQRLFRLAHTPRTMLRLDADTIARTIYPVGFYKTKSQSILAVCRALLERYQGRVPHEIDELLTLQGVGRKTANLVLTQGFGLPGICVDTHVHRITNRWGYVRTRTPEETETCLREILPPEYWIEINDWLVAYGQNLCTPTSPWCSRCLLTKWCARVGVGRSR